MLERIAIRQIALQCIRQLIPSRVELARILTLDVSLHDLTDPALHLPIAGLRTHDFRHLVRVLELITVRRRPDIPVDVRQIVTLAEIGARLDAVRLEFPLARPIVERLTSFFPLRTAGEEPILAIAETDATRR